MRRIVWIGVFVSLLVSLIGCGHTSKQTGLWEMYESQLKSCKYVDLTHAFSPTIAVWPGFGNAKFKPTTAGADMPGYISIGQEFEYDKHGFIATSYEIPTDQYGTQLDPPAHWEEYGATISDLPCDLCRSPVSRYRYPCKSRPG